MKKMHILTLVLASATLAGTGLYLYTCAWYDLPCFAREAAEKAYEKVIKPAGEGIKTGFDYVKEKALDPAIDAFKVAADKTGVTYVATQVGKGIVKVSDATGISYVVDETGKVLGKAVDLAKKGAEAGTTFVIKSGESTISGIDALTGGAKCAPADVECFVGSADNLTSCGTNKESRGFNWLQGGCKINSGDVQNNCKALCERVMDTKFEPKDISFRVLSKDGIAIGDFFTQIFTGKNCNQTTKVQCYAGYDKLKKNCGAADIGYRWTSLGQGGCVIKLEDIKPACDRLCQAKFKTDSN